jgi:hypothetical protein
MLELALKSDREWFLELEHSSVAFYERAVDLLARADELSAEINRIREQQRRRPRLLAMLNEAGFGESNGRAS